MRLFCLDFAAELDGNAFATKPHRIMPSPAKILLVSSLDNVGDSVAKALSFGSSQTIIRTNDFYEAKALLDGRPTLLVTSVKLGAFNGLHLALRASAIGTPAIVFGEPDLVLERDASSLGVKYVTLPLETDVLRDIAAELLMRAAKERRSVRRPVQALEALADDRQAQLLDVSYEGMRLEADAFPSLPRYFEVRVPRFKFACQVERIWTAPAGKDGSHCYCGAAMFPANPAAVLEWRALVDALPAETTTGQEAPHL